MAKFFEVDFHEVGRNGSGDAICIRYADDDGVEYVHVVDGGYTDDGEKVLNHIEAHYGNPGYVDHVVLTHPDGDHAAGLKKVLEEIAVGVLWLNRPWNHVDALMPRFDYEYTRDGLIRRLRKDFPFTAALEEIAIAKGIEIREPLQDAQIGPFTVLAPSRDRYIELVVQSEKTPDEARKAMMEGTFFEKAVRYLKNVISEWGQENLKGETEGTSSENEVSVVQYAELCGEKILLTGDAGIEALQEAYQYAVARGVQLPGIDRFDVPHHGSRRNLSSDVLDLWLGPRLPTKPTTPSFTAIVSANRNDENHPRKAVVRALIHRGAKVVETRGTIQTQRNAPDREGWGPVTPLSYPSDMEE